MRSVPGSRNSVLPAERPGARAPAGDQAGPAQGQGHPALQQPPTSCGLCGEPGADVHLVTLIA